MISPSLRKKKFSVPRTKPGYTLCIKCRANQLDLFWVGLVIVVIWNIATSSTEEAYNKKIPDSYQMQKQKVTEHLPWHVSHNEVKSYTFPRNETHKSFWVLWMLTSLGVKNFGLTIPNFFDFFLYPLWRKLKIQPRYHVKKFPVVCSYLVFVS